jgi:glycosyltransferase involved in cell wall biosynthesis
MYELDNYAIWFGVIEPSKNQLVAIRALRDSGTPLVFVGRSRDRAYYQTCRSEAPANSVFIDGLPYRSEIMRAALQEASYYIEISKEPAGLSAIAAGLAGCRLVLSDSPWAREHFDGFAQFVDPESESSVRSGVAASLASELHVPELRRHLQKHSLPDAIIPLLNVFDEAVALS